MKSVTELHVALQRKLCPENIVSQTPSAPGRNLDRPPAPDPCNGMLRSTPINQGIRRWKQRQQFMRSYGGADHRHPNSDAHLLAWGSRRKVRRQLRPRNENTNPPAPNQSRSDCCSRTRLLAGGKSACSSNARRSTMTWWSLCSALADVLRDVALFDIET